MCITEGKKRTSTPISPLSASASWDRVLSGVGVAAAGGKWRNMCLKSGYISVCKGAF